MLATLSPRKPLLLLEPEVACLPEDAIWRGVAAYPRAYVPDRDRWIVWRRGTPARLRRLMEVYDLAWCAPRGDTANQLLGTLLRLPAFPLVSVRTDNPASTVAGVEAFLAGEPRPLVWVTSAFAAEVCAWARRRHRTTPTLLLRTAASVGVHIAAERRLLSWAGGLLNEQEDDMREDTVPKHITTDSEAGLCASAQTSEPGAMHG